MSFPRRIERISGSAYALGLLGKTLATLSAKEEARARLTQAHDIYVELRKSAPLDPAQETFFAELEKLLSQL